MSKLIEGIPVLEAVAVDSPPPYSLVEDRAPIGDPIGLAAFLTEYDWPVPLQNAFIDYMTRNPVKIFINDDSGSMSTGDGSMIVPKTGGAYDLVQCSRWEELCQVIRFQMMACNRGLMSADFVFLNRGSFTPGPDGFRENDVERNFLSRPPSGGTPLCTVLRDTVIPKIRQLEYSLRSTGRVATIVIATDGEASDGDITPYMRELKDLPVHIVLRLCTNDDRIVGYWNRIDSDLEMNMDVLDDLFSEAEEVRSKNPWLCYNRQLHEFRSFGATSSDIDMLDETALTQTAIARVKSLFYASGPPHSYRVYCPIRRAMVECCVDNSASRPPSATPQSRTQGSKHKSGGCTMS